MGEYHDLYLITDVLLLADVFEKFREVCYNKDSYELDPVHYCTSPGLDWSAMLKMTTTPGSSKWCGYALDDWEG